MRAQCVGLRAIMLVLSVFALTATGVERDAVAAEELEQTRAAKDVLAATINAGQSRKAFASAILSYCTQTSNHLPRNTQKEDEQIAAELASNDPARLVRTAESVEYPRYQLQKVFTDCAQISKSILEQAKPATMEAAVWVRLEGTLDFDVEHFGAVVGIFRKDEKGNTLSDLHGLRLWPVLRVAIRGTAILPLLESRKN